MIPFFNIEKLRSKTTELFPEGISFSPEVLIKKEPKPYVAKVKWYKDYGLIAEDKFNPSRFRDINTFPKKFRWIDMSQYDLKRLRGENWGSPIVGTTVPPAHMIFNKGKFWPSAKGFIKGERIHDAVLLDIVENYFKRRSGNPHFFMGNVKDIDTLAEKPFLLNQPFILNDRDEVRDYPFTYLKPISHYRKLDGSEPDFFERLFFGKKPTLLEPDLIQYARPMTIRDHVGTFVSSIMPMFGPLYSNYPLDELYPHIFEKAE